MYETLGSLVPSADAPAALYAIEAWTDEFATWPGTVFELNQKAGSDLTLE